MSTNNKELSIAGLLLLLGILGLYFTISDRSERFFLGGETEKITIELIDISNYYTGKRGTLSGKTLLSAQYRNKLRVAHGAWEALQEYRDLDFLKAGDTLELQVPVSQYQELKQYSNPGAVRVVGIRYKGVTYLRPESVEQAESGTFWLYILGYSTCGITGLVLWMVTRRKKRAAAQGELIVAPLDAENLP
ncbi:hypothetical protein [Chitinophaga caseinilytica]|uniref:hypothetical protein n=1 Tax=Chitinophaga caseinilytica TaxID=2267521 RepID=UPI003C2C751D